MSNYQRVSAQNATLDEKLCAMTTLLHQTYPQAEASMSIRQHTSTPNLELVQFLNLVAILFATGDESDVAAISTYFDPEGVVFATAMPSNEVSSAESWVARDSKGPGKDDRARYATKPVYFTKLRYAQGEEAFQCRMVEQVDRK
jgi:hypothetical protein